MSNNIQLDDKLDFSNFIEKLLSKWYWVVLFVFLGTLVGFLTNRYRKPVYQASATIRIEDKDTDVSEFLAMDMFSSGMSRYDKILTEAAIIKSRSLIGKSLEKLPLNIRYYKKGLFSSYELYKRSPITLNIISSFNFESSLGLTVDFQDSVSFVVSYTDKQGVKQDIKSTFEQSFEVNGHVFSISESEERKTRDLELEGEYFIRLLEKKKLVPEFNTNLKVIQSDPKITILSLIYQASSPLLAKDFVEALATQYVSEELNKKVEASTNAIVFIDERLEELSRQMQDAESKITEFKEETKIINFEAAEKIETERLLDLETQKRIAELRLLNLDIIESELSEGKKLSDINISLDGNVDPVLTQLISIFNDLKVQKATMAVNFTGDSRKNTELNSKITQTINSIRQNIAVSKNSVEEQLKYLNTQIEDLSKRFALFPKNQQNYFHLIRDFEVNQKVISFLMEKKIEASISNASIVSSARIIDLPIIPENPISISRAKVYLISIVLSVIFGLSVLILVVFFDNKIRSVEELKVSSNVGVLGAIAPSDSEEYKSIEEVMGNGRTVFKESISSLRTNLRFLPFAKNAKIISVTSTVSQEGKSFSLANLAFSLAALEKKVLIMDFDMRKPKMHKYFDDPNSGKGVSMVLAGNIKVEEAIKNSAYTYLDYINAGPIPPNPMELIQSERFISMLDELRERYDYVLIDNPPVGIVSDAIYVLKNSDVNLYVVRANYSKNEFLKVAEELEEKHQVSNLYYVLNDAKNSVKRSYYTGYYTESSKTSKWQISKIFRA